MAACDLDVEVGSLVAVDVAGKVAVRISQLARVPGKGFRADQVEGLVSGCLAVRVDPAQVDLVVLAVLEVQDFVLLRALPGVGRELKAKMSAPPPPSSRS